jgi:hypothetical protein
MGGFIYHAYKKSKAGELFDPFASTIAESINTSRTTRFICYGFGMFLMNFFIFIQYSAYESNDH